MVTPLQILQHWDGLDPAVIEYDKYSKETETLKRFPVKIWQVSVSAKVTKIVVVVVRVDVVVLVVVVLVVVLLVEMPLVEEEVVEVFVSVELVLDVPEVWI